MPSPAVREITEHERTCRSAEQPPWLAPVQMQMRLWFALAVTATTAEPAAASTKVDLHLDRLQLGSLELRDVTLRVRDGETCVTAQIARARVDGCGTLTTDGGDVRIERGHLALAIPAQAVEGGTLGETTVTAAI